MSQVSKAERITAEARELFNSLGSFVPTIPDEVTTHVLTQKGVNSDDIRLTRLISLATQKFAANVAYDALQVQKRRKQATAYRQKELGYNPKDLRVLLTTEDLSEALQEYGVNMTAPPYFADRATG